MIAIDGIWYDGKTSAQVKAVCRVYGDGSVRVERYEDGHLLLGSTRRHIQVSPRLADTPRYLIFPGGEKLSDTAAGRGACGGIADVRVVSNAVHSFHCRLSVAGYHPCLG